MWNLYILFMHSYMWNLYILFMHSYMWNLYILFMHSYMWNLYILFRMFCSSVFCWYISFCNFYDFLFLSGTTIWNKLSAFRNN
jgi:hypothetical protein